jgi:hypothetical protein
MTRLEQNKMVIESIVKETARTPAGSYNEMIMLHLGALVGTLADISKSLAILADKVESEGANDK